MTEETKIVDNFASLGLADPLLKAITESGYTTPTPIQAKANTKIFIYIAITKQHTSSTASR